MGRKPALSGNRAKLALAMLDNGDTFSVVAKALGVSTTALRKVKNEARIERLKAPRIEVPRCANCAETVDLGEHCLACCLALGLEL